MTNIRRHGFESDKQWREYLVEIEEGQAARAPIAFQKRNLLEELSALRQQISTLRDRITPPVRQKIPERSWLLIGASSFLVALATTVLAFRNAGR